MRVSEQGFESSQAGVGGMQLSDIPHLASDAACFVHFKESRYPAGQLIGVPACRDDDALALLTLFRIKSRQFLEVNAIMGQEDKPEPDRMFKLVPVRLPEHTRIACRVNLESFGLEKGADQNVDVLIGIEGDLFAGEPEKSSEILFLSIYNSISS